MNIKQINEELDKFMEDFNTNLENRYDSYIASEHDADNSVTFHDFNFISFSELSDVAFEKFQSHVDEINGVEKDLGNGIVFFTSGDSLSDREEGYINIGIEVKDGVELTEEVLDSFDTFREDLYKKYIQLAGYKNTDGDIYDITPTTVDFVIEPSEDTDFDDDVLAVFPFLEGRPQELLCYRHLGQHGSVSPDYYKSLDKATKAQYLDLYNELTDRVGYNLNVLNTDF